MRRNVVIGVLSLAVVLGVVAGTGAHALWPGPFGGVAVGPGSTPSSARPEVSVGTPAPSDSGATSAVPTPDPRGPSATPKSTARPSGSTSAPAPAFTRAALLLPSEFQSRGWVVAEVIDTFDAPPAPAITACASVAPDEDGLVAGYAATYTSHRTGAAELVVRLDPDRVEPVFERLRALVAGCADSSVAADRVRITGSHHPTVPGIDDLRWWNTRPLTDGDARGVIGIVRVDDRIAVLTLRSDVSDPAETTQIENLLVQAGRRLV